MKTRSFLAVFAFVSFCLQSLSQNQGGDSEKPLGWTMEIFRKNTNVKDKLVLVNFSADWCVVCKKQKPVLDAIKKENKEKLIVLEIDMEDNPLVAEHFEVDGLPVNLMYKNGILVWNRMGFMDQKELQSMIKSYQ